MINQDTLVLIGEDEPDNRIILQTVVEALLGVRAETAGDGLAVLASVERERPRMILLMTVGDRLAGRLSSHAS